MSFLKDFDTHFKDDVRPLNPAAFDHFKEQVATNPPSDVYNKAVTNMQRTVSDRTVPACQRCNKAMYRLYEHTMAVYRCFHVTAASDSVLLEKKTKAAHNARKVVQQIAIYFLYDGAAWSAKSSAQLLLDAALWRCIAFLHSWGQTVLGGGVRLRLIALFYASFYIHAKGSVLQGTMSFEVRRRRRRRRPS